MVDAEVDTNPTTALLDGQDYILPLQNGPNPKNLLSLSETDAEMLKEDMVGNVESNNGSFEQGISSDLR